MSGLWRADACKHLIVSIPTAPLIPPPAADDALPPLSHPCACAACRSTRLRRGSAVRSCPPAARCLGAAARRPRGGDGGDERGRGGRLVEAVEIIDSKMTKDARGGRQVVLATFLLCPTSSDGHRLPLVRVPFVACGQGKRETCRSPGVIALLCRRSSGCFRRFAVTFTWQRDSGLQSNDWASSRMV